MTKKYKMTAVNSNDLIYAAVYDSGSSSPTTKNKPISPKLFKKTGV